MSHPEISVVMGVYNSAPSLSMTINSVLSQEGVDIEFIVVDDGPRMAAGNFSTNTLNRIADCGSFISQIRG